MLLGADTPKNTPSKGWLLPDVGWIWPGVRFRELRSSPATGATWVPGQRNAATKAATLARQLAERREILPTCCRETNHISLSAVETSASQMLTFVRDMA